MKFQYTLDWDGDGKFRPRKEIIAIEGPNPPDDILRTIERKQCFYEYKMLWQLSWLAPRGGIFFDIGANIGNHSIYFAKFLAGHVVAFEPNKELVPWFEMNMRGNGIANYTLMNCALGNKKASGRLELPSNYEENRGLGRIRVGEQIGSEGNDELIEIDTLDHVVPKVKAIENRPIDLVKIDTEGMEMDVLNGAVSVLTEHHPHIYRHRGPLGKRTGGIVLISRRFRLYALRQARRVEDVSLHELRTPRPSPHGAKVQNHKRDFEVSTFLS